MRILVVGATGTIGRAVAQALSARHEVVAASHAKTTLHLDIASRAIHRVSVVARRSWSSRLRPVDGGGAAAKALKEAIIAAYRAASGEPTT